MPTYAYRCSTCGHRFEARQPMSADPLTECPACSGSVKRLIQNVPVVFKGTGWYINDSRKKSESSSSKESEKPATGDGEKPAEKAKTAKTEKAAAPAAAAAAD